MVCLFTYLKEGEKLVYIDDNGRMQCTECCISCNVEKRLCGARKERKRLTNRMKYKAKKELKRKQGEKK